MEALTVICTHPYGSFLFQQLLGPAWLTQGYGNAIVLMLFY